MTTKEINITEKRRLLELVKFEQVARSKGFKCVAGIDEAGRGPLAGPVIAAACVIPEGVFYEGIDDSKQLSEKKRKALFLKLIEDPSISYSVAEVSHLEIDHLNIYQATLKAMKMAVDKLPILPDFLLVDGMPLNHRQIPSEKIIHGDSLSQSIAAASIIAKETRDQLMSEFDQMWPQYGFSEHKGYGTKKHLEAIYKYGPCPIHRLSFKPLKTQVINN